jgi:hypothetical protein
MARTGRQRPRPAQVFVADAKAADVGKRAARQPQRLLRLAADGSGERLHEADQRLVLGVFAGAQVGQSCQHGLGGDGVAA